VVHVQEEQEEQSEANNANSCSACGEDDELLFLCDACPRAMCETCVAQAHLDPNMPQQLQHFDVDREWNCCVCLPPPPLQELQQSLVNDDSPPTPKSKEELLMELEAVEQKKLECEQTWEHAEETREAIQQELLLTKRSSASKNDAFVEERNPNLDKTVQEEFDKWKDDLERHEKRLSDMVSCLHDELETHDFNLKEYYATTMPENNESSSEPSWKQTADKAIMEREQEDRKLFRTTRPSSDDDDDDDDEDDPGVPQDIEDLGNLSDHSEHNNNNDDD
jgi:hypothetical protein